MISFVGLACLLLQQSFIGASPPVALTVEEVDASTNSGGARVVVGQARVARVDEEVRPRFRPPEMAFIAGGEFLMGSPISDETSMEYHEDERPQRKGKVRDFYLSRFLVTAEEFSVFLNDQGDRGYGRFGPQDTVQLAVDQYRPADFSERCPASSVNWFGAVAYCEWVSAALPAAANWTALA